MKCANQLAKTFYFMYENTRNKRMMILKCCSMKGLFSHDCKGASKSSRTKKDTYIKNGQICCTAKKMNLLWWYFSGILKCGEKCTGPLESYPNLRKVTSGLFWTISDKTDFLPKMDKVGFGRGASEQNINSCLKRSKGPRWAQKGS